MFHGVVSAKAPLRFTAIGATKTNRLEATPRRLPKMIGYPLLADRCKRLQRW